MLAKELTFVARTEAAGLVLGAEAPVMLASRADNDRARLASCALAQLYQYYKCRRAGLGGRRERSQSRGATPMSSVTSTINAGSSSIKFTAFAASPDRDLGPVASGQINTGRRRIPASLGESSAQTRLAAPSFVSGALTAKWSLL